MALINKRYDVSQLGEFGESGFGAASFPEIKDAIARKMMEIYGNDIDISSASADGQYIMMEALIVNNMYRSLENIVRNLNPASASGGYLDILASFSGAFRQQPTYSKAQLYIWNTSANALTPDQIVCVDKNGNPRELHTEMSKAAIDYSVLPDYRTYYEACNDERVPLVSCDYFTTSLLKLTKRYEMPLADLDSFVILICTAGSGTVTDSKGNSIEIRQGESVLVPADVEGLQIDVNENLELLTSWID